MTRAPFLLVAAGLGLLAGAGAWARWAYLGDHAWQRRRGSPRTAAAVHIGFGE